MAAAHAIAAKSTAFAKDHWDLLQKWADYLVKYGIDPEDQLCTDDFAGHLAHNCNLSIKAIMGIESFSIMNRITGYSEKADYYEKIAHEMAVNWLSSAANSNGTYRLAFDQPDTSSMKYNMIWDKAFGTKLFPPETVACELQSYLDRLNPFGLPLDNRATYTKSDWLVWSASLSDMNSDFLKIISSLWDAYNTSPSRVPMTDWYDTLTA